MNNYNTRHREADNEHKPCGVQKQERKEKKLIANNFNEFVITVSEAERKVLNTPIGQELTEQLLKMKLEQNPNITTEEWQQTKIEFMTFLFAAIMKEMPEMMKELSTHVWNELQEA